MSVKREEVRELLPVGWRVWVQCDGCGKKSATGNMRVLDPTQPQRDEDRFRSIGPPEGWLVISTPYNPIIDVRGEHAHACERCKDMPASRLLEMAGITR